MAWTPHESNQHRPSFEGVVTKVEGGVTLYGSVRCTGPECEYQSWAGWVSQAVYERHHEGHARQYEPDRAPDIEVNWVPDACCSVCADGIGDIRSHEDGGVWCQDCGTVWDVTGRYGERSEREDGAS